jgi:DMSO/TMAO reductase YedYZ molybdopterin-dependent catalytic subunit
VTTRNRQAVSFTVSGAVAKPGDWTVERLARELASEARAVEYDVKGVRGRAVRAVPLGALVRACGPRLNPKAKNHFLAFTVYVRANDGYTVAFSGAELTPDVGKREVWIALDRNGQPLPGDEGPVEILVPGDAKLARWVHGVSRVVVADGLAATEPAPGNAPK